MSTKTIEKNLAKDQKRNTMTFTYESLTSSQADSHLWNKITNKLNSFNKDQASSAKIATSDMKGKDARAVIIHCNSKAPNEESLGTTWTHKSFETSSDYDNMYNRCVEFLNSSNLSEAQRYYSVLTMTNASQHNSRLVLFYREI